MQKKFVYDLRKLDLFFLRNKAKIAKKKFVFSFDS